jgi:hypothetical protein
MRTPSLILTLALSSLGLNAIAGDAALDVFKVSGAAACKPSGDGTFSEIVTTMASVLPPEQSDALLAKYCSDCMKQKFNLNRVAVLPKP